MSHKRLKQSMKRVDPGTCPSVHTAHCPHVSHAITTSHHPRSTTHVSQLEVQSGVLELSSAPQNGHTLHPILDIRFTWMPMIQQNIMASALQHVLMAIAGEKGALAHGSVYVAVGGIAVVSSWHLTHVIVQIPIGSESTPML